MNKLKSLSLVALAAFGLSAYGGTTTNDWWNVTLEADSFQANFPGLEIGQLGALTNDESTMAAGTVQPYAAGVWSALDGDESYVTNGLATNWVSGSMTEVENTTYLKLDTQGNDLTWTPDTTDVSNNIIALVDADLYLVGSDSAPDASDFDSAGDVHTAVYLKNETDEDSGNTTNSVLCVYVYDSIGKVRYWQELDGEPLDDNAWAHVQVVVDYAEASTPMVQVFVNGTQMHARDDASTTSWTAAIKGSSATVYKLSSVAFRGTGAVDNFVGTTQAVSYDSYNFTAEVYMDGVPQAAGDDGNLTRVVEADAGEGKTADFTGFSFHDFVAGGVATYALSRIEISNLVSGAVASYQYGYNNVSHQIIPETPSENIVFEMATGTYEDEDTGDEIEYEYQTGAFTVSAPTVGATADSTIVNIYFKTIGAYDAYATTTVDGATTTNAVTLKPVAAGGVYPTNVVWTFDAVKGDTILTNLVVSNGATFDGYANGKATVKVTVGGELAADTLYAAASYVAGALADGQDLRPTTNGTEIVFAPYTPPVAMIGTTEYPSLRAAIETATSGDTIKLVHDDHVSFTAEAPELMIDKAITIDGGSNTLYGVSGHACATIADRHNLAISGTGDVTIKDLTMTQFSDTATVQYYTYPIWVRGAYGGTLTLDGVTIADFSRTAVNISGGAVVITNCVFTGDTTRLDANGHAFQGGVEVGNGLTATVTIADTVITGMGSVGYPADSDSDMAAAVQMSGKGSITIESGTFAGQYSLIVSATATGGIVVNGGEFDGDVCVEDGAGTLAIHDGSVVGDLEVPSALTAFIDGGWFETAPAATYLAEGYKVVEDVSGAPVDGAYNHVVPDVTTYAITFKPENGEQDIVTNVVADATAYAPADPTLAGFDFLGWTNALDATDATLYSNTNLPPAAANATYAAKYEASAVTKPEVDVGQGLKDYVPAQGETVPAPIEFTDAATPLCELSFVAPEAGWYFLYTSTTVNGEYTPDYTTKVQANKGALVTLTESAAGTTKFFKIGWSETEPTAE